MKTLLIAFLVAACALHANAQYPYPFAVHTTVFFSDQNDPVLLSYLNKTLREVDGVKLSETETDETNYSLMFNAVRLNSGEYSCWLTVLEPARRILRNTAGWELSKTLNVKADDTHEPIDKAWAGYGMRKPYFMVGQWRCDGKTPQEAIKACVATFDTQCVELDRHVDQGIRDAAKKLQP